MCLRFCSRSPTMDRVIVPFAAARDSKLETPHEWPGPPVTRFGCFPRCVRQSRRWWRRRLSCICSGPFLATPSLTTSQVDTSVDEGGGGGDQRLALGRPSTWSAGRRPNMTLMCKNSERAFTEGNRVLPAPRFSVLSCNRSRRHWCWGERSIYAFRMPSVLTRPKIHIRPSCRSAITVTNAYHSPNARLSHLSISLING